VTLALQTLDDSQLIQRRDACDHHSPFKRPVKHGVVELGDVGAGENLIAPRRQPGLAGDRAGGGGMIAGEHDEAHARLLAAVNGVGHPRAQRIADAQVAQRHEIVGVIECAGRRPFGHDQDTQPALGQPSGLLEQSPASALAQGRVTSGAALTHAARQQHLGSALETQPAADERGVVGARRVKRGLPLACLLQLRRQSVLLGGAHNRHVGGMSGGIGRRGMGRGERTHEQDVR
jgi:hypothetical protein